MSESLLLLESGDKVGIFGDFFVVDDRTKGHGKIKINLKTYDPDIEYAYIEYLSEEKSLLHVKRLVDCKISKKNIVYNNSIYQITNEYYENDFSGEKIQRNKIYELEKVGQKKEDGKIKKIMEYEDGKTYFYEEEPLSSEDIEMNPEEEFTRENIKENKKIKFKFKEMP